MDGKQFKRLLLAGAIQSINKQQSFVREEDVASRLWIFFGRTQGKIFSSLLLLIKVLVIHVQ